MTLVELIMGITVMMIVVTLAVTHVTRNQRAYNAIASALDLRARLRDGSDILVGELRGISPTGDSILVASDTAVEFFSAIGTSTLCAMPASDRVILPPDTLASGRTLSSWVVSPEAGDDLLIFIDAPPPAVAGWQRASVVSTATISTSDGCPVSTGLLSAGDVAASGHSYQITISPSVATSIRSGAPVRIVRRVRYSVYRAGDRKWYLGYRRCISTCAGIQPVSGPYESEEGVPISFRYFTRGGTPVTGAGPAADVGRVEVVMRAAYSTPFHLPGTATAVSGDSMISTVSIRNR
jgi:hypothetical protein